MSLLDWIYPPRCISCRMIFEPVHNTKRLWLCENCKPLLTAVPDPICRICGHPANAACPSCMGRSFHFKRHRAALLYDDVVRELIHNIKFRSHRRCAQGLGHIFAEAAEGWGLNGDYIVPIPLHPSKKRSRGFNQAAVLALPVSKSLGISLAPDMIKRINKTAPQSGLSVQAREQNLSNAFIFNGKKYGQNKKVILIDDIFTSGATMNACSLLLMENGINEVNCISLSIATIQLFKDNFSQKS